MLRRMPAVLAACLGIIALLFVAGCSSKDSGTKQTPVPLTAFEQMLVEAGWPADGFYHNAETNEQVAQWYVSGSPTSDPEETCYYSLYRPPYPVGGTKWVYVINPAEYWGEGSSYKSWTEAKESLILPNPASPDEVWDFANRWVNNPSELCKP